MVTLDATYNREQALRDGTLIDLTDLVRDSRAGIPYPTAVSAGLWNRPRIDRDPALLDQVISLAASDWLKQGCPLGKFEPLIFTVDGAGRLYAMDVQLFAESFEEHGKVVTFVSDYEEYDLRCPRAPGGSFHSV